MSVQFGRCNFDGKPVDQEDLEEVRPVLAPYGPDGEGFICQGNYGVLYRAFHTTSESHREIQPYLCRSGAFLIWDGRLDNREQLIDSLDGETSFASTDLEIAAAAYDHWGTDSFARWIGDWAVSIWEPRTETLLLARDFVGARHLYYSLEKEQASWCTILEPLVLFAGHSFKLEEEFIAGWLSFFPAAHLTPYVGIHAVPPSSFVRLVRRKQEVSKYWSFNPAKTIRYRTDHEFEEHFRAVLRESVRRRLRSNSHVLAELSGGIDSSSIVCLADSIREEDPKTGTVDTVSYFDDSEPNWIERPFFCRVEQQRGRAGCHIDVSAQKTLIPEYHKDGFTATPRSVGLPAEAATQFSELMVNNQHRVLLCGIGGDEVLGGLPSPIPELATLLAAGDFHSFGKQIVRWALANRTTVFALVFNTVRTFLPTVAQKSVVDGKQAAEWLHPQFVRRNWRTLRGYQKRTRLPGPQPSFQDAMETLECLQRQLGCSPPSLRPLCETRYPYLDRDFLEYVFAVPRQQLVRPNQRRSLMRRALSGIVPDEILSRKRKAFVVRGPLVALSSDKPRLIEMGRQMMADAMHIVRQQAFLEAMDKALRTKEVPIVTMTRTIRLESWLRHLASLPFIELCPFFASKASHDRVIHPEEIAIGNFGEEGHWKQPSLASQRHQPL